MQQRQTEPDFGADREWNSSPPTTGAAGAAEADQIRIGKTTVAREGDGALVEVFTMTLGTETIPLLPFKN